MWKGDEGFQKLNEGKRHRTQNGLNKNIEEKDMLVVDFNYQKKGETSRNTKTLIRIKDATWCGYGWVDEQQEHTQYFSELTFSLDSSFSWQATVSKKKVLIISQSDDLQIEWGYGEIRNSFKTFINFQVVITTAHESMVLTQRMSWCPRYISHWNRCMAVYCKELALGQSCQTWTQPLLSHWHWIVYWSLKHQKPWKDTHLIC